MQESEIKSKARLQPQEESWSDKAIEVGNQVAVVAVTGLISGFCAGLGGALYGRIRGDEVQTADVLPMRRVGS